MWGPSEGQAVSNQACIWGYEGRGDWVGNVTLLSGWPWGVFGGADLLLVVGFGGVLDGIDLRDEFVLG